MPRTLASLRVGESSRVVKVAGDDTTATQRLMDMGLVRGTTIEVVRLAPLGDPIEIRVRGFMLTLRRTEAEHVTVE
jgi:ferrous iron transport protein A